MTKEEYKEFSSEARRILWEQRVHGTPSLKPIGVQKLVYRFGDWWLKIKKEDAPTNGGSKWVYLTLDEEAEHLRFIPQDARPRTFFLKGGEIMVQEHVGLYEGVENYDAEELLAELGFSDLGHNMRAGKVFDWGVVNTISTLGQRALRRRKLEEARLR